MRKFLLSFAGALLIVAVVGATHQAGATPITFDLNCVMEWETEDIKNDPMSQVFGINSFGTITLTDNGDNVDILVDLIDTTSGNHHRIKSVYLNYDDSVFDSTDVFLSSEGVVNTQNGEKANGYNDGMFDLQIPPTGNIGFEPYSDTISLASFNLNPDHFDFAETFGRYYAVVHVGNFGGTPGVGGDDSLWVGACDVTTIVPEPATLFLVGSGLFGLAGLRRKFRS